MAAIASPQSGAYAVHVNQELSTFSLNYRVEGLIAEQLFSPIAVSHMSDQYAIWDKGNTFRVTRTDGYGDMVADGAEAEEEDFGWTQGTYKAKMFKRVTKITDNERANQDSALQLETSKVAKVQDKILLNYEIRVANLCTTTSNFASTNYTTLAGANQWNSGSFASSTNGQHSVIMGEILTGINAIRQTSGGRTPNTIVIPFQVAMVIRNDPGLWASVQYTSGSVDTDVLPRQIWGMDVLIPKAPLYTSVEGEAVSLATDVWGKNVFMCYRDPAPGLNCLTFGMTFRFRPWTVKTWRREEREATFYEASIIQDEKLVSADVGYLISNCIA